MGTAALINKHENDGTYTPHSSFRPRCNATPSRGPFVAPANNAPRRRLPDRTRALALPLFETSVAGGRLCPRAYRNRPFDRARCLLMLIGGDRELNQGRECGGEDES